MSRFVLLIALVVGSAPLRAQAPAPAPTRMEALGLLARARQAQLPGSDAADAVAIEIASFEGAFRVRLYDYADPAQPKETDGTLRQYWARRTEDGRRQTRYRRDLSSDATKEVLVLASDWDGFSWRRKDKGRAQGQQLPLNKKEDRDEVRELQAEKRRVDELFRLFLLDQLPVATRTARMGLRDRELALDFGRNSYRFRTDQILFADREGNDYELWIDRSSHHPVKARVRFAGARTWETFTMAQHFAVPLDAKGERTIVVPCNVVYHDESNRPRLMLSTDTPAKAFRFNVLDARQQAKLFRFLD